MKKVFFFDRDGTLIEDPGYLNDPQKIKYYPNTFSTLKKLRDVGYEFIIITNQSGLPRGLVTYDQLMSIHQKIRADFSSHGIEFLDIFYAPSLPSENHPWRKPNPGMITEAFRRYPIDKENSYVVGDSECDVGAGQAAGLKTFFLKGKACELTATYSVNSLSEIPNKLPASH